MKRWSIVLLAFSMVAGASPTLAQNQPLDSARGRLDGAPAQETAAKRPFTFEDMMKLKRVNEPVPSPDGRWVVFSAVDVDLAANTRTPHIWIVPADGSAKERRLISTPQGEDRPRWSPDGKYLSFTGSYDGNQQVWVAEFDAASGHVAPDLRSGGTEQSSVPTQANPWAHKATSISTEADGQLWSPNGKNILFVSQVYPECNKAADQDACNKAEDDKRSALKTKAQIFSHLLYRHWKTYSTAKRSHLFVQPVNADGTPNGRAYDITPGDHDVPPFSLGGSDMYDWSPDGKQVAYTSNIDEVGATSTNNDVFIVKIAPDLLAGDTKALPTTSPTPANPEPAERAVHFAPTKISTSPGSDSTPRYSPDGKYIAYLSQARAGYESDRFRLMLYERATGKITELTNQFDRWVGSYVWAPDSKLLFFSAENQGESPVFSIDLLGRFHSVAGGHFDNLAFDKDGYLLATRMSSTSPNEIFTINPSRSGCQYIDFQPPNPKIAEDCYSAYKPERPAAITHLNQKVLEQVQLDQSESHGIEPFWFAGANQTKVEGFLIKPPNLDEHRRYPVKFLIHGGPEGNWGDEWSYRWNAQLFAANGYVVVQINPRGSTGYGQKFIDEINGDWSGKPITDLMMGLDYAIKKYPFIDGNRVCAMGASWGGYAVNWLIGHTNRFKCAVTHDGMFNTVSAYGTTEELWFPQWEFKGNPYTQLGRANYERVNPLNSVKNFKTPTLVSHGQLDYRLDLSEGLQLFTALQMQKVPSKMLYFPDEGHWVLKPQNSELWYRTVNGWVDQWVGEQKP
jgi:dipeptidyl aminopeptidase/acylaminoacyl peptidase